MLEKDVETHVIEVDTESIVFLKAEYPDLKNRIIEADFLKFDLQNLFGTAPFAIIGNFPYNISTQIVFKTLENRNQIPEFSGMFQKEVAKRVANPKAVKPMVFYRCLHKRFIKRNTCLQCRHKCLIHHQK